MSDIRKRPTEESLHRETYSWKIRNIETRLVAENLSRIFSNWKSFLYLFKPISIVTNILHG